MPDKPLSVFISYSRDSDEHSEWVRRLADALEERPEFNVIFDQYDLHGGKDLTHFMDAGLSADRIVVVMTPDYVRKAADRIGGVAYESSVISAELLANQLADRFVPALRRGNERPTFLKSKVYVDFRDQRDFERALVDLIAALQRQPYANRPHKKEPATHISPPARQPAPLHVSNPVIVVMINCEIDGEQDPTAVPTLENLGAVPVTNVKVDDIVVPGNRGPGAFMQLNSLAPRQPTPVRFDAPAQGPLFRSYFVRYLEAGLESRPPIDWDAPAARDAFAPMQLPLSVTYTDPSTCRHYRSEHELTFTFSKHVSVKFLRASEIREPA